MRTPLALLVNDIHISKDNIAEFQANWAEMMSVCEDLDIGDVVIGGDLWTSRSAQTLPTLLAVKSAILKATSKGLFLTIAEGNHCKTDQEALEGYSHLFDPYFNVKAVDVFEVMTWEDCDIVLAVMSYFPENGSFVKHLNELKEELTVRYKRDLSDVVLYIHEGIQGALGNFSVPNDLPVEIFNDFNSVLVGHYHNRIELAGTDIMYIGSSRQGNFGEDEMKGYTILYDDGSISFVQNEVNFRYATEEVAIDDIDDQFLEHLRNSVCSGEVHYKIRVRVMCTDAQAKNFDKKILLDNGASKVEMVTEKTQTIVTQSSSIEVKYDKNGIKKEYQNFCQTKEIDSKLGLKYLDKLN